MLALQGYYDGKMIQPLGEFPAKKNQKLIITVLDEFMSETSVKEKRKSARGVLSKYANPVLWEQEKMAWEKAVIDKYGDA
ncbi:MAG: hypothetical protein K2N87_06365 [Eubacterium sp.]|nr:hypothetical protein [Eubacterium sp.]